MPSRRRSAGCTAPKATSSWRAARPVSPAPPLPEELRTLWRVATSTSGWVPSPRSASGWPTPARTLTAHRSLQQVADTDVPQVAAAARGLLDGSGGPHSRPGAPPMPAPIPAPIPAPVPTPAPMAAGQTPPESTAPATPRRSIRRRWLAVGVAALAGLVVAVLAVVLTRQPEAPRAGDEFSETSPWRLVIKNNNHCRVTLRSQDSPEVWTTRYESGLDQSWQIRQSGTYRWESTTPECVILHRPGAGELTLPAVVAGGQGDTNAFRASRSVKVEAKDMRGNQECDFGLIDSESGDPVDFGELTTAGESVVLQTEGRPWVYLANGYCTVRLSTI